MGGRVVALWSLCAVLSLPATVRAQTPRDRAGALILEGDRLHARGEHRAALKQYLRARRLQASPLLSYQLGITLLAIGRPVLAAEQLQQFLAHGRQAPPQARSLATARLRQLQRTLGSVSVSCTVAGVKVLIDGRMVGRTLLQRRFFMRPGRHRVELQKAGYFNVAREVVLEAGVFRQLDLLMKGGAPALAQPHQPTPAPPPHQPTKPREAWEDLVTPDNQQDRRRRKKIYAYSTLGASVALLAGAGVLYGVGASRGNTAHDSYLTSGNQAQRDYHYQDVEAAQTMLVVGHVLAGAGAVVLGLSIYHFATRSRAMERQAPATTVGLVPMAGGATITMGGWF